MYRPILRRAGASLLVVSIWSTAIAVLPTVSVAQDTSTPPAKDKDAKKDQKAQPKTTATPVATTGPLGPKDDPALIGKRNINSGTDKLFGWLGGSQEKEIQIGRQLAMEVEQR